MGYKVSGIAVSRYLDWKLGSQLESGIAIEVAIEVGIEVGISVGIKLCAAE